MGTRRYSGTVVWVLALVVAACGDNRMQAVLGDDEPCMETVCGTSCVNTAEDEAHCGACDNACAPGAVCVGGDCQDKVQCSGEQVDCGNTCVDPKTDETNCGACGTTCDANETCVNGTCETTVTCTAPEIACNNTCVDPRGDEMNCGACGTTCDAGETCVSGTCETTVTCTAPEVDCNNACVDITTDEANCGACGATCGANETCTPNGSSASCQPTTACTAPQVNCNNTCVDITTDEANCGACGTTCGANETCTPNGSSATCQATTTCTSPQVNCDNTCVDTATDDNNCGSCGNECTGATPDCVGGVCNPLCAAPTPDLCNMACTDFDTDEMNCGSCGSACALDGSETCTAGQCVSTCTAPLEYCNGLCVDTTNNNANCGACGTVCPQGTVCSNSGCVLNCTGGTTLCGNTCVNTNTDALNCGTCGNQCTGGKVCSNGGCVCPSGTVDCNGTCRNTQTDDNNCGGCGTTCAANENCVNGTCELDCTAPLLDCGGTACVDSTTSDAHCGACNSACTGDLDCQNSQCVCPVAGTTACGDQCVNTQSDNSNCGTCGNVCPQGTICSSGTCQLSCQSPTTLCDPAGPTPPFCTNTATDPENCGMCENDCGIGAVCSGGTCACPANIPDACPGLCTNFDADPANCGDCGITCDVANGESCSSGICCPAGQVNCNGVCRDLSSDEAACGSCTNQCAAGAVCNLGVCECPFGQTLCNGECTTTVNDPNACGPSCEVCSGSTPFCVSNGCTGTCPAPLEACGNQCVNKKSDSDNCGACGNQCPAGQGCSGGVCVPQIVVGPDPAKCQNGGPPIDVPVSGGSTCTGGLAGVTFRFGLCSCTNVGPLGHDLLVDAFDSRFGPYTPTPTQARMGGGIGVNGTIQNTANIEAYGDLWVFGAQGQITKGDVRVHDRFFNKGRLDFSDLVSVNENVLGSCSISGSNCFADADCGAAGGTCVLTPVLGGENAWVGGAIDKSGGGNFGMTVSGELRTGTTPCSAMAGESVTAGACIEDAFPDLAPPCDCDPNQDQLIPVRAIVDHFRTNNDNALIGLSSQALNGGSSARLDLPCGVYYFDQINISQATTIVVHGRTAIAVGGSIVVSQPIIFDLEPDATLDIFVAGVVKTSQDLTLGNPAYPRLSRMYVGSPGCSGSGACQVNADCCSGVCQQNGFCLGGGGGNISESFGMSGNSFLNGLLYAGFGTFRVTNPLVMNGAVFANYYDSVQATIHFDKGAVDSGDECPPPANAACDSCRDCDNQACIDGQCTTCQQDSDCCAPLRCVNGGCQL